MLTLTPKITLTEKGSSAPVAKSFSSITVDMQWTGAADLDLMVGVEKKDGAFDLLFYGNKAYQDGQIALAEDAGVGDKGGDNKEQATIKSFDGLKRISVFCADYGKIQSGQAGRFDGVGLKTTLRDDQNHEQELIAKSGEGNISCLAIVDLSGEQPKVINVSESGKMSGLNDTGVITALHNTTVV